MFLELLFHLFVDTRNEQGGGAESVEAAIYEIFDDAIDNRIER